MVTHNPKKNTFPAVAVASGLNNNRLYEVRAMRCLVEQGDWSYI